MTKQQSSAQTAPPPQPQPIRASLIARFAAKYSVDPDKLLSTLKGTVFKGQRQKDGTVLEATNEQLMALLIVADQYDLNPFTKEIYAFPDKKNGIIPVVSVDGWLRIINSHPQFSGLEFKDCETIVEHPTAEHPPAPAWIEVTMHRRDRQFPITVREYFAECYRPPFKGRGRDGGEFTSEGPWQTHPSRFLRHKTIIQCARVAFGFAGIYDQDEAERIAAAVDITSVATMKPTPEAPRAKAAPPALPAPTRSDIEQLLDRTGVPVSELLEKLELAGGALEDLPETELPRAAEWLRSLNVG